MAGAVKVEYDDRGRRLSARDILMPEQAEIIANATERIIAGESLRSICMEMNGDGVPAPRGGRWNSAILRQLLLRPRNAGLQVHQKQIIGAGKWDTIISKDDYHRISAILTDPNRRTSPGGTVRNLLSGIALCGLCDSPVRVLVAHGKMKRAYVCQECFGVRRNQAALDSLITRLVTLRLAMPDAVAVLTPDYVDVRPVVAKLEALRARLDLAADDYADGVIDAPQLRRITAKLRPRIEALESQIRVPVSGPELADLATPDIGNRWDDIPLERRRQVIATLLTLRVLPARKKGRAKLDPNDLEIVWQHGAATQLSDRRLQ
jgi:site-specific DNA recombinase